MTITESSRHHMLEALSTSIGTEAAMTLAEHLPPSGWADVATTADVERSATLLRGEIAQLGTELRGEIAQLGTELRGEMRTLRAEFGGETGQLRQEMKTLRAELRDDMARLETRLTDKMIDQNRLLVVAIVSTLFTILASAITIGGLVLAQG